MKEYSDAEIANLASQFDDEMKQRYPSVHHVEEEITDLLLEQRYLERHDVERVIKWKLASQGGRAGNKITELDRVSDEAIVELTKTGLMIQDLKVQIDTIAALPGIGPPTATAILTFDDPENCAVADRILNKALFDSEHVPWTKRCVDIISYFQNNYPSSEHSLREIEKAYFVDNGGFE